ncbi:hypothetical protein RND81_04G067800 [Saponaria officinalis]|uniref:Uncharacterized protein n=1 Tax=Saponaria officinalis TaxID=3572 RepID=A0AAW1LCZ9_SAPOF
MQTPKARNGSVEVSQRKSQSTQTLQKSSPSTNHTSRPLKITASGSDSGASPNTSSRTPRNTTPKVLDRGSPGSPMTEKKRVSKLSELESQLAQLEDELKKSKEQLNSSETLKLRAMQEVEEMKKQLAVVSTRLEESQQQLHEFSTSDDNRIQELRKLSKERDRVWQLELDAIQKQRSMDSAALASALNEIQKLKKQLKMVTMFEAAQSSHKDTAHDEIERLRFDLSKTVSLVENMRNQLSDCKRSEVRALEVAKETQTQLGEAMTIAEALRSELFKSKETYKGLASELERSKEKSRSLESLVKELEENLQNRSKYSSDGSKDVEAEHEKAIETMERKAELDALKLEICELKSALEASELKYQEEYVQSMLQIRNAFDLVERSKSETGARQAELDAELKKARSTMDELKSKLTFKETEVKNTLTQNMDLNATIDENETDTTTKKSELETELKMLKGDLEDLKAVLLDKETKIQSTREFNEMLKAEIQKRESSRTKTKKEISDSAETAKAAEQEALMKLGYTTEEADKSSRKSTRVAEQLDAAQIANTELEAELRRLKVQSDQWRKAAEEAAVMLSTGSNGKFVDCTVSLDSTYTSITSKMDGLTNDMDDDYPKKKNGNMLKKIGVLWKKGQK